jgi:hypothetical protein
MGIPAEGLASARRSLAIGHGRTLVPYRGHRPGDQTVSLVWGMGLSDGGKSGLQAGLQQLLDRQGFDQLGSARLGSPHLHALAWAAVESQAFKREQNPLHGDTAAVPAAHDHHPVARIAIKADKAGFIHRPKRVQGVPPCTAFGVDGQSPDGRNAGPAPIAESAFGQPPEAPCLDHTQPAPFASTFPPWRSGSAATCSSTVKCRR